MDEFEAIVNTIPREDIPTVTETVNTGALTFVRTVKGPVVEWVTVQNK